MAVNRPHLDTSLIPVRLPNGVIVMHTRVEYGRLWENVDKNATRQMFEPLDGPGDEGEG